MRDEDNNKFSRIYANSSTLACFPPEFSRSEFNIAEDRAGECIYFNEIVFAS